MSANLPLILIEVVLIFGGVLAFGWWQLWSLKKDREQTARERERREGEGRERAQADKTVEDPDASP